MELFNMTQKQEILGTVLKNRINSAINKLTLDVVEMQNIIDLFLAGDRIVITQYNELKALLDSYTTV
jgi:hypothetical protein